MAQIKLIPDLSHCIETVAKREYRRALDEVLAGVENEELEIRIELLRTFLKETDFKVLRQDSEKRLMEGRRVEFLVYMDREVPKYEMRVV